MEKKILLLADKIVPVMGANEICVNKLLARFADEIITVCRINDCEILVNISKHLAPYYFSQEKKFSKCNYWEKIRYVLKHVLSCFFSEPFNSRWAEAMFAKAEEQMYKSRIDTIIAIMNPAEAVEVGYRLKKQFPHVKFIIYDLDTISHCSLGIIEKKLSWFYNKRVYQWEQKVYAKADLIIHLAQHEEHFKQTAYSAFLHKTLFQELPLLEVTCKNKQSSSNEIPVIIYAGSFYNRLRDPDVLMKQFAELTKKISFKLLVYTNHDYVISLKEQFKEYENFVIKDFIPEEELRAVIDNSDFLVSLGNSYTTMFPSKVISYICALKPIIHIFQSPDDPVNGYLKDYPAKVLLNMEDGLEYNAEQMMAFIQKEHPQISSEQISALYYRNSGAYNANMILDFFKAKET